MKKTTYQSITLKVLFVAAIMQLYAGDNPEEGLTNRLNHMMEARATESMRIEAIFEQEIINFSYNIFRAAQERLTEIIKGPPPPPICSNTAKLNILI